MTPEKLQRLIEAALMAYGKTMSVDKMMLLFEEDKRPSSEELKNALNAISEQCEERGVELKEVASGYRFQAKQEFAEWVARLWEEKPPKYSRALLETVALIAYRQPITRAEIEEVRGVSVSSHIVKTLLEREWVRVVGHRDVPGRPALYATTKEFLDYFNLKSLEELPSLAEIRDLEKINAELELEEERGSEEDAVVDLSDDNDDVKTNPVKLREQQSDDPEGVNSSDETMDDNLQGDTESSDEKSLDGVPLEQQAPLDHSKLDELNKRLKSELSDEEIVEEAALAQDANQIADPSVFDDSVEPESYVNEPQNSDSGSENESELESSLSSDSVSSEMGAFAENNESHVSSDSSGKDN